jgi:hypothetical protein
MANPFHQAIGPRTVRSRYDTGELRLGTDLHQRTAAVGQKASVASLMGPKPQS